MSRMRDVVVLATTLFVAGCKNDPAPIATNQMSVGEVETSTSAQRATASVIPMQTGGADTAVSCATAFSTEATEEAVADWLIGYWSGLNVGRRLSVGSTTDANGIMREIKLDCQKNPSATLHHSAYQTFQRMRASRH